MSATMMHPVTQPTAAADQSSAGGAPNAGSSATPFQMKAAFKKIASPGRQNAALALSALFRSSSSSEPSPAETMFASKVDGSSGKAEVKSAPVVLTVPSSSQGAVTNNQVTADQSAPTNGFNGNANTQHTRSHSAPPTPRGHSHGGGYQVPQTDVHSGFQPPPFENHRPYVAGPQPPFPYGVHPGAPPMPMQCPSSNAPGAPPMPMQCPSSSNAPPLGPNMKGADDGARRMKIFMEATRSVSDGGPPGQGPHVTPSPHQNHYRPNNSHMQHHYPPPPPNYMPVHGHMPPYPVGPPPPPHHQQYHYPPRNHPMPPMPVSMTPNSSVTPRPQKKQKLNAKGAAAATQKGVNTPAAEYRRGDKSLGLLCKKFMTTYANLPVAPLEGEGGSCISIDDAARNLGVERRRIYDIINILEAIQIVSRERKNTYRWHGAGNLPIFFARVQAEAVKLWREDAKKNGLIDECDDVDVKTDESAEKGAEAEPSSSPDAKKEKSLGKLSVKFIQLFLVGNETISLTDASDRILGTQSAECLLKCAGKSAEAKEAARGMKTKIRRLYDIANVMASLDVIVKVNSGSSYTQKDNRPSFRWIYKIHPKELPEILTRHEQKTKHVVVEQEDGKKDDCVKVEAALGPTASAKKLLANINQRGGDDGSRDVGIAAVVTQDESSDEYAL